MKMIKSILVALIFLTSENAFAWVVNGVHSIEKLGVNHIQVNVILSNGQACYVDSGHPNYKILVSLLHTLYASGKSGYFRCTETSKAYSPWETNITVYEILEVTGQK